MGIFGGVRLTLQPTTDGCKRQAADHAAQSAAGCHIQLCAKAEVMQKISDAVRIAPPDLNPPAWRDVGILILA